MILPVKNTDSVLREFFIKAGGITPSGAIRRSTLLSCKNDFLFLRGTKLRQPPLNLSKKQEKAMISNLPSFAAILLYCSAIDLLARVMRKKIPKNKSKQFFTWSAKKWFGLSRNKSLALWKMRCAMSHQYKIEQGQRAVPHGFSGSMTYDRKGKKWVFNINGMFGDINKAIPRAYSYIEKQKKLTRHKYAKFIFENGFFYTC